MKDLREKSVDTTGNWLSWNYENIHEEGREREREKGSHQEKLKPMNGGEGVINDLKHEEIWESKM